MFGCLPEDTDGLWVNYYQLQMCWPGYGGRHHILNVQSSDQRGDGGNILFWNEKQGVLSALLGQEKFPDFYIAQFSKPIYQSSLLTSIAAVINVGP